jgi:4-amino-4-deoxy-L-arabinose transferase-like glycosyltransferase/Tfp pilus assembly protein PilF
MKPSFRKSLIWAIGIFILAFTVRFVYLSQLKNSPLFDTPVMDPEYHDQWAQAIVEEEDFTGGVFFRAPLYPYFLALVYRIFGHDYLMARMIQFLIGSLSCVLIYFLGKRIFNNRTAVIAGVMAAFYGVLIYFEGELLIPVLLIFLDMLFLLALLWSYERPSSWRWFLCGALLGLSALARPNILLVGAGIFLWILLRSKKNSKVVSKSAVYAGFFVLGAVLVISPVTLRNYIKGDDFVLIASQGGMNFYIGNNPQSDGVSAILPGTRTTWWGSYKDAKEIAEKSAQRSLKPSEVSNFWYMEGLKFAAGEPCSFMKLMATKFFLFWNGNELSNNRDLYFFARLTPLLKPLIWRYLIYFPLGLIVPLAIVGMILAHKGKKNVVILEIFLFLYMLSMILFFVTARYRVPTLPVLILFSAFTLDRFVLMIKNGDIIRFGKYMLVFLVIMIPVNIQIPGYSSANPGQAHYSLGVVYSERGNTAQAKEEFNKALTYNPNLGEAVLNLGSIYGDEGKYELALNYYQRALQIGTDSAFVLYNMGIVYHIQGLWDQAVKNYELSLSLRDDNPKVHYLLGEVYLKQELIESALFEYESTLKYDPLYAMAFYRRGMIYHQLGKTKEAISNLENFIRLWKGNPERKDNVIKLLEELKGSTTE